jgi:spermidine/putrescine transport system substrate-binding protein
MKKTSVLLVTCLMLAMGSISSLEAAPEKKVVNFYNWSEYLPASVLKAFTKETGIKVNYSTFDSNEMLYSKLKTLKGKGYDLIVPSTYLVSRMRREGMLHKLDKSQIPNFKNLDPGLLNAAFDPGNEFSIPYLWGTTGIVYNTKLRPNADLKAWKDLWSPDYRKSLLVLDDVRDIFAMALRTLGYSINDTDEAHILEAYAKLKELMPNIKVFNSETPKVFLIGEEVSAGMTWNGEAFKANRENPNIAYVYPREGSLMWMDSLAVPEGAKNIENAYALIDFLLRPDIAKIIVEDVGYATPNAEAFKLLPESTRSNRMIYPTDEDRKKAEMQVDVGDAIAVYERYWSLLKVGR